MKNTKVMTILRRPINMMRSTTMQKRHNFEEFIMLIQSVFHKKYIYLYLKTG